MFSSSHVRTPFYLAVAIVMMLASLNIGAVAFASEQGAKQFATALADSVVGILENDDLSQSGKERKLQDLLTSKVDLDWVARFVLGRHWRTASDQQKQSYLTHYKNFIVQNYTQKLAQYAGQGYDIKQVRQEGEPDEYMITLEVKSPNEPPVFIDYRIREKSSGGYKIFDIIVEGVSMITTQRSEFNSVVSNKGLDFLISALEKRAQQG